MPSGMIKELSIEDINTRIDVILTRALLTASEGQESDPQKIYSDVKLHELVVQPIQDLCFEEVDSGTKNMFLSNDGALARCTKLLSPTDKAYTCRDCSPVISFSLCEECLRNSRHFKHNHAPAIKKFKLFCHCGDTETYKLSPPCPTHEISESPTSVPLQFVKRISHIIRHLFECLELLCGEESSLDEYVKNRLITIENVKKFYDEYIPTGFIPEVEKQGAIMSTHGSCLLIFRPEFENPENVYSCVRFANPPGKLTDLLDHFKKCGYLCVMHRNTYENCHGFSFKIQKHIHDHLPGSGLQCRVYSIHRLFFMKLSSVLIRFINETCLRKSELCDLMSEILFNETSLPEKFFFNRSLWKDIRYNLIYRVVLPTLFSRNGAHNLAKFYLQNFDRLYSELLVKSDLKHYLFRLATQLVISKTQFTFLVGNWLSFLRFFDFHFILSKEVGIRKRRINI
ncbi:E3 ubiquitin-protein ligase UBR1 [Thelohanellus kitauei]|uniref:E3 ubiquitin-protein ligase n=1 Tax=Thelohanellus kitauei TaxID=669202 RepID=A0A0C2MH31_THEKT|nr:E3 ubiquitin-protein ligase UBR1 [Thelohanellus kitauei]